MDPVLLFALIGALGIGSQWIAWRVRVPAIVMMLAAGLVAGPGLQLINPAEAFGEMFRPVIAVAVAVILFEGGLTLNFRELKETGTGVRRLVFFGAPLGWLFSALAAHYAGGLSWASSAVFGGILIVTGPTVIMPLLRQARLASRPAGILRWESIVNDPVGALAAVLAFEVIVAVSGAGTLMKAAEHLALGIAVALVAGWLAGRVLAFAFRRGHVPEYMKVPVLFGAVLLTYAATDKVLHESGLLAVTVMGIVLANAELPSFVELRRFKEHATVILVSGVFVMLAASLEREMIAALDWQALAFVVAVVFVARPLAVWLSLIGTDLPNAERGMIAWIGPRGVVAVAVSGLFGTRLVEAGIADGALLAPLAFAVVAATVVLHGFSIGPLARALGLTSTRPPGVLIVGASRWTTALGEALAGADIPVLVADTVWWRLRRARLAGLETFHGEILSEAAEHSIPMNQYAFIVAATENDAYNALVCTDFGPEFGRGNVFEVGRHEADDHDRGMPVTLGGRSFAGGGSYDAYAERLVAGWSFALTALTEEFSLEDLMSNGAEVEVIAVLKASGAVHFASGGTVPATGAGDRVLTFRLRETSGETAPV